MAKKEKSTGKFKESAHRSKLRKERENRLRSKQKQSQKKKINEELVGMVNPENIDELDIGSKKKIIKQLRTLIISFPNENYDKIKMLMTFLQDKSIKIILKTMKYLKELFFDLLPSYKMRTEETENKGKRLSKEVDQIQNYEKALLKYYENFINMLDIFTKTFSHVKKSNKESIVKLNEYTVKTLASLFEKFFYFNHSENIYRILIEKLTDSNQNLRIYAFDALKSFLSLQDNSSHVLELKLSLIKLISHIIFIKPHDKFNQNVLDLLSCHRISLPDLNEHKEKYKMDDIKIGVINKDHYKSNNEFKQAKKEKKQLMQEKDKIVKNLRKEMGEYENVHNPRMIYNLNLKMLKKILLLFFDMIKHKRESPLIRSVFSGIGILCENINVEILLDLQKNLYEYISYVFLKHTNEGMRIFAVTALKTNLTIAEKLTKEIISIEDTNLINSCYLFLSKADKNLVFKMTKDDLFTILEILETILLKNRQFSLDTVAAFVKRLSAFCNMLQPKFIPAFLLILKRIIQKYPQLESMNEKDDDFFNYSIVQDPSITNAKQSNIVNEITEIHSTHSTTNKLIKQMCDYIQNAARSNPSIDSLNFFDLLLK